MAQPHVTRRFAFSLQLSTNSKLRLSLVLSACGVRPPGHGECVVARSTGTMRVRGSCVCIPRDKRCGMTMVSCTGMFQHLWDMGHLHRWGGGRGCGVLRWSLARLFGTGQVESAELQKPQIHGAKGLKSFHQPKTACGVVLWVGRALPGRRSSPFLRLSTRSRNTCKRRHLHGSLPSRLNED